MPNPAPSSQRIVVKLSGAAFKAPNGVFAVPFATRILKQLQTIVARGYEVIVIIGGGNIFRPRTLFPFPLPNYTNLNYAGMLATVLNAFFLQELATAELQFILPLLSLLKLDQQLVNTYNLTRAEALLSKHRILLICGGTGVPFFTTDTAAAVVAKQLNATCILLGKQGVDGVYNKDPHQFASAKMYTHLTFQQLIVEKLQVFDLTAASFHLDHKIEMRVFNIAKPNALINVLEKKGRFTTVNNHD